MALRIILTGVIGGICAALALSLPLYFGIPRNDVEGWPTIPVPLQMVGYLLAALVLVASGHVAVRWEWVESSRDAIRAGTQVGALAGLMAFALIAAGAAGVAGLAPVFHHGIRPSASDAEFTFVCVEVVTRVTWFTYLAFWGLLAAAALLGAIGGRTAAHREEGVASPPASLPDMTGLICILVQTLTILTLATEAASWFPAIRKMELNAAQYASVPTLPLIGAIVCPLVTGLIVLILTTMWLRRWCERHYPAADARLCGVVTTALPVCVLVLVAASPELLQRPEFLAGVTGWIIAAIDLGAMLVRVRLQRGKSPPEPPITPDAWWAKCLSSSALAVAILPALTLILGTSLAISLAEGLVPFLNALNPHVSAEEGFPTMAEAIQAVFWRQLVVSSLIAGAAGGGLLAAGKCGAWWIKLRSAWSSPRA